MTSSARLYLTRIDRDFFGDSNGVPIGAWCLSRDELFEDPDLRGCIFFDSQRNRKQLRVADQEIATAFEKLLPVVGSVLNQKHGTTYSTGFWRVTCGFWFRQYLDILYDRYLTLRTARKLVPDAKVALIPENKEWFASDTDNFSVAVFSDRFNHQIFGQIVRARQLFDFEEGEDLASASIDKIGRPSSLSWLKNMGSWSSCIIGKFNKVVVLRAYFAISLLAKLALRFHFIPLLGTPRIDGRGESDLQERLSLQAVFKREVSGMNFSDFECLAMHLISHNIPIVFLEQFDVLMRKAKFLRPHRAKLFLTANAFAAQEIYKVWVGLSLEERENSHHVIMQHGGHYGHSEVFSNEDFEVGSCGEFLTSGWACEGKTNVRPFYLSVLSGLGDFRHNQPVSNKCGDVIWVLASLPRYPYMAWSWPQGSLFLGYLREQVSFLNILTKKSRNILQCRPYHYDYGWNDLDYITHHAGIFRIDNKRRPLRQRMGAAQLMVFTYDSTSMMESMVMNVPTICFWDPDRFAWRPQALPLLDKLAEAGIYYERASLAANFINKHVDEGTINQWWTSPAVQKVRREYCKEYANTADGEYALWSDQIKHWLSEN